MVFSLVHAKEVQSNKNSLAFLCFWDTLISLLIAIMGVAMSYRSAVKHRNTKFFEEYKHHFKSQQVDLPRSCITTDGVRKKLSFFARAKVHWI